MKNKVWECRHVKELTVERLHELTGISASAITRIENGETNDILLSHAVALAHALQTDLYELFCIPKIFR